MNIDHLLDAAIRFGIFLISLSIHEAAHAWTADRLGDPTARMLGRVSLNPVRHIDPIGTILMPLIAAVSHLPLIGWAKPVPVNPRNLANPRRDFMIVAAAGPISNLLQATAAAMVLRLMPGDPYLAGGLVHYALLIAVQINLLLAFFNLIPVPPLDGGNVMLGLLPPQLAAPYSKLRQFGFIILYVLMFSGAASAFISPPTNFMMRILLP